MKGNHKKEPLMRIPHQRFDFYLSVIYDVSLPTSFYIENVLWTERQIR